MKSKIEHRKGRITFTLVELLVVIAVIVILLALLAPALDSAIYQAELAVCGSSQPGIGAEVTTYAASHKRAYPGAARVKGLNAQALNEWYDGSYDLRVAMEGYLSVESFADRWRGRST